MAVLQAVEQGKTSALGRVIPLPRKPHRDDCPQLAYLERQGLLYSWNLERWGHAYDLSDRAFWRVFSERSVPTCTCAHRVIKSNWHIVPPPIRETQPVFLLHFQRSVTAPIVGSLRHRLAMMLATETNDFLAHYQEIDTLAVACGDSAHAVLERLREFEEHAERNLRHRRHSSSSVQGSPRRKSSASS